MKTFSRIYRKQRKALIAKNEMIRAQWENLIKRVFYRDRHRCVRCLKLLTRPRVHHVSNAEHLKTEYSNIVTMCEDCESFVHSDMNVKKEWLV